MLFKLHKIIPDIKSKSFIYILYLIVIGVFELIGIGLITSLVIKIIANEITDSKFFFLEFLSDFKYYNICIFIFFIFLIKFILIFLLNKSLFQFCFNQQSKLRNRVVNSIFFRIKNYEYDNNLEFKNSFSLIFESCRQLTEVFLINFLKFFCDFIIFIIILIFLFFFNFQITFILFLFLFIVFFFYKSIFKKKIKSAGETKLENYKNLIEITDYIINGLKEIVVFRQENECLKKINTISNRFEKSNIVFSSLSILPKLFIEFGIVLFLIFMVMFSNVYSNITSVYFISLATTYAAATLRLAPLLNTIIYSFTIFWNSKKIINDFLHQFHDHDLHVSEETCEETKKDFKKLYISNLNFQYGEKIIFKNFKLTINKNEIIGVYGKSGSGKSTLIDILLGFKKPQNYYLEINDKKIDNLKIARQMMSYIPQNIFLYNDSIKKNIILNDENYDKIRYDEALNLSGCCEFINQINVKDNYIIGRAGNLLSGGQKQRVALARSIYHKRKILILDEPTSSLDSEIEMKIFKNLLNIKEKISILVISHNKDVLKICDRSYELI